MATLGQIGEFNPAFPEKWDAYEARLNFHLEANDITNPTRKRAVFFFSVCGAATFDLVQSLLALATPKTKTFSQPSEIVRQNAFTGGIRVPRSLWPYSLWNYGGCHKTATFQISRKHCEIYSCVT
ncbi:hypothetical protein ISCGN_029674 [Ixodes scapularis]